VTGFLTAGVLPVAVPVLLIFVSLFLPHDNPWIDWRWNKDGSVRSEMAPAGPAVTDACGQGSDQLNARRSAIDHRPCRSGTAYLYRLRLITADPLSLRNRTVCDLPCNTMLITPDMPYSLL
jgi:hypothetical protein